MVEKIKRQGKDRDINKDRARWEIQLKSARELNGKIKGKTGRKEKERGQKSRENQ